MGCQRATSPIMSRRKPSGQKTVRGGRRLSWRRSPGQAIVFQRLMKEVRSFCASCTLRLHMS
jgi:hypothetical protein